ncbi:MAG TPA: hypothetical protein VGB37_12525, partial [Candidatus Lokiarchaeia archaeon]
LLKLIDNNGKKAQGWINGVGAGETLESEILLNPNFVNIDNWNPQNCNIASIAGGQSGNCLEITPIGGANQPVYQNLNITKDALYYLSGYVKSGTSGDEQFIFLLHYNADIALVETSTVSWVQHSKHGVASATNNYFYCQKNTTTLATMLFDEVSLKRVTDPPATGIHIVSMQKGLTRKWSYIETGFDPNNISSWEIYELIKPSIVNRFSKIYTPKKHPASAWFSLYNSSLIPERKDIYASLLYRSFLIGWYWNDRGVGSIIHNMALEGGLGDGLLPHLDIINGEDLFWSEWAIDNQFGSLKIEDDNGVLIENEINRNLQNCCIGLFFKITEFLDFLGVTLFNIYGDLINIYFDLQMQLASFDLASSNGETPQNLDDLTELNWGFLFQEKNGTTKLALSNGTILTFEGDIFSFLTELCTYITIQSEAIGSSLNPIFLGDILIFNNKVLTVSEWGKWYDILRSRYGMAERAW